MTRGVHQPGIGIESLRIARIDDATLEEHVYIVRPGIGQVDVVGGDDHIGPAVMELLRQFHDLNGHLRIQARCRLVHHEHLRPHGEGAGQCQPLPLTVRQLQDVLLPQIVHPRLEEGLVDAPEHLLLRQAEVRRTVGHVGLDGLPEHLVVGVLQNHRDPRAEAAYPLPPV